MPFSMRGRALGAFFFLASSLVAGRVANAEVEHVVGRGHTIDAIANRYHVTAKAIIDRNHLKDVKHLRPGDVLVIPTKADDKADKADKNAKKVDTKAETAKSDGAKAEKKGDATTYAMKPKTPGVVHAKRVATSEDFNVRVTDRRGRMPPVALKSFEKLLRSPSGLSHPIDARLVSLLGVVSNHFGSRKIEIVSGFRPYTPTQYTPHSNHNHGKAVDFRVVGVPNEAVRDFCRVLKKTGCGYYPNSVFVHMDVREQSAFWIDYSKPGEAPRYNAPDLGADEGASDVHDETHLSTGTAPDSPPPTDTPSPSPDSANKPDAGKPPESAPAKPDAGASP